MGISDLYYRSDAPISFVVRFINTPRLLTQIGGEKNVVVCMPRYCPSIGLKLVRT